MENALEKWSLLSLGKCGQLMKSYLFRNNTALAMPRDTSSARRAALATELRFKGGKASTQKLRVMTQESDGEPLHQHVEGVANGHA